MLREAQADAAVGNFPQAFRGPWRNTPFAGRGRIRARAACDQAKCTPART